MDRKEKPVFAYYVLVGIWVVFIVLIIAQFAVSTQLFVNNGLLVPVRNFPNTSDPANFTTIYGTDNAHKRSGFTYWSNFLLFVLVLPFIATFTARLSGSGTSEAVYNVSMLFNILVVIMSIIAIIAYVTWVPGCNASPIVASGVAGSFNNECNDPAWCGVYGHLVPSCPNYNNSGTWFPPVAANQLNWDGPFVGGLIITSLYLAGSIVVFLISIFSAKSLKKARTYEQPTYFPTNEDSYGQRASGGFNNDPSDGGVSGTNKGA